MTFDRALTIIRKAKTIPRVVSHTVEDDRLVVVFADEPKQSNAELERAGYWVLRTEWAAYGFVWVVVMTNNKEE